MMLRIMKTCYFSVKKYTLSAYILTGTRHAERTVFDTLNGFKRLRKPSHFLRLASDGNDLKAVVMVQMYMLRRYYQLLKNMLKVRYPVQQLAMMMIIYERNCAGYLSIGVPLFLDKFLPDEVPKSFGAVNVALFFYELIEPLQQFAIK